MAAGDVVITGMVDISGSHRLLTGTVVLDGGNATPVTLTTYVNTLLWGMVNMDGSVAPGDDPSLVTSNVAAAVLNVYAWKNTSGTDPTLVASTDNARVIDWIALGTIASQK